MLPAFSAFTGRGRMEWSEGVALYLVGPDGRVVRWRGSASGAV